MADEERGYYSTEEVCQQLGNMPRSTVIRHGLRGVIPGMFRVGKKYHWWKAKIDEYVSALTNGPPPPPEKRGPYKRKKKQPTKPSKPSKSSGPSKSNEPSKPTKPLS